MKIRKRKRRKRLAEVISDLFEKHEDKGKILIFWVKIVASIITVSSIHLLHGHSRTK